MQIHLRYTTKKGRVGAAFTLHAYIYIYICRNYRTGRFHIRTKKAPRFIVFRIGWLSKKNEINKIQSNTRCIKDINKTKTKWINKIKGSEYSKRVVNK